MLFVSSPFGMILANLCCRMGEIWGDFYFSTLNKLEQLCYKLGRNKYQQVHFRFTRDKGGAYMSAESLSLVAGTSLSLGFSYIPGARRWFEEFDPEIRRLIMLALLVCSACIVYAFSCLGWAAEWGISLVCDRSGLFGLIEQLVLAIIANQSIYAITPRTTQPTSQ